MGHAHVIPHSPPPIPRQQPTYRKKQQQQQQRPVSMGSVVIPQQNYCHGNSVAVQQQTPMIPQQHYQQQPVYQYYYQIPLVSQPQPSSPHHHRNVPPSPLKPTSNLDHFRRRSMNEVPRKTASLDILPSQHRMPSAEYVSPGLHHRSSADNLPRTTSSISHCRLSPSSRIASQQQHPGSYYNKHRYHCQPNITALTRSASTMTGKSISSSFNCDRPISANPRRRSEEPPARVSAGPARRVTPFKMESIAEERRDISSPSLEDEEEIPLAMLHNKQERANIGEFVAPRSAAAATTTMKRPDIQYTSIEMTSRCNSSSTASSSRPSFISNHSSSGESAVTSNCSSVHQTKKRTSPLLSPPSSPFSDTTTVAAHDDINDTAPSSSLKPQQQQGRKPSMTKRLFSSMHRLSRAVLISPASSSNVKSVDKKQ
ncbi:hypothetical protein BDB00DRAFT_928652 [Zychaea mexicana]|uniref:uncharacterized protein n=1 Tax=Zychaea mexicana TaxID=64656 RepID=UPI0022FEE46F|nr:uncharacterized protein BDB00DRAFT_928652 [Zychaea mexicana]KAI9493935.1 hypothetical protein BDB00DRAFT_928652 [Zychaea mexicana]